jgi:hypothetical protein
METALPPATPSAWPCSPQAAAIFCTDPGGHGQM